ncbi:TonB-dependent receptor [Peristeroidobacter soli]|jgi:outer membrane receptor protein involved in Fe transport|uniref:TonB-dependent receptor n=1 Tax=Peristeroidobacter soli TaxID=2497877 RepID=UPI00158AABF3|nr:TonB-dependent receptor [Peristeroidobacter soli]
MSGVSYGQDVESEAETSEGEAIRVAATDARSVEGGTLATVVVTARNREEKLQDVPLSVSVVNGEQLQRLEAVDLSSFASRVANVFVQRDNPQHRAASIRGIGMMSNTHAQDPSVGIIVDGVNYAYNPLAASVEYTDVASLEVTRGPQGTLMGKNATLGVINVITKRPSFTPEASYSLGYGDNETFIGRASGGGPLIDDVLAWRGSLSVQRGAGAYDNKYRSPDDTYVNTDRVSGRAQLLWQPTADFSARLSVNSQPRTTDNSNGSELHTPTPTFYADGSPNPRSSDASTRLARRWFDQFQDFDYERDYLSNRYHFNDGQGPQVTGSKGASLELNWQRDGYTITSVNAYNDYHFNARYNDEGTPFAIQIGSGNLHDYRQVSQELRLSSQIGDFVDYQTGVYYINTRMRDQGSLTIYGADAGAWYANNSQYTTLDRDAAGRYLMQNSIDHLGIVGNPKQDLDNTSQALFGQANWHFTPALTLTTGLRFTREDRKTSHSTSYIYSQGYASELNPVAVNGVPLGGFASTSTGALNTTDPAQIAVANAVALKYFGVVTYTGLSDAQLRQVAAAKSIRAARIGRVWNDFSPPAWKDTQPSFVVSPSYRINDDVNTYVSWQYGEKAGISQARFGVSAPAKAEKNSSYELGVKAALFDRTLTLNADVFVTDIEDYQQAVQIFDEYTTSLNADGNLYYMSATGNANKVRAKGLEIDGSYDGIEHLSIRFAGAYNDAYYRDFPNAGQPEERGNLALPYRDASGLTLPGASKYTFNVGADYRHPIFDRSEFRFSFNTAYLSKYKSDVALSEYSWIPGHSITDLSLGIATTTLQNNEFEISLLVKNVFDDDTPFKRTWNLVTPADPRWAAIVVSGKL